MNTRRMIVLLLAAAAAVGAALVMRGFLGGGTQAVVARPAMAMAEVLVASTDIAPGQKLNGASVRWQKWPKENVSPSFLSGGGDPESLVKGTVARSPIVAGEPLTFAKIVRSEGASFMAATLTPGMRAVSIPVSVPSVAGGFVQPGDRVDVLVARNNGGIGIVKASIVLENVRVLAIDQTIRAKDDKPVSDVRTATLELMPKDTEILVAAQVQGTLALALRPLGDGAEDGSVKIVQGLPPGYGTDGRK